MDGAAEEEEEGLAVAAGAREATLTLVTMDADVATHGDGEPPTGMGEMRFVRERPEGGRELICLFRIIERVTKAAREIQAVEIRGKMKKIWQNVRQRDAKQMHACNN
jgi:hypothetical protein